MTYQFLRVSVSYEAGNGEKTSETSFRKSLMNCPRRENPFALKSIEVKLKKFFTALGNLNCEATMP